MFPKCALCILKLPVILSASERLMTDDRKYAILFAATLLAARKLIDLDPHIPLPAKSSAIDRAINHAKAIIDEIDRRWPSTN
jgi:hypothetical protein